MTNQRETMNIVIVGHVDHGKSTLIGRLLADTHSLPEGKLEQVKQMCQVNARPFEYAFLLDALKDEQAQGITIDTARSFFKTQKREYIIIDAPGHIEFLKNMITGAARAEAAMLLIDANEGVKENSRRHGYMLSMLGIKQVVVVVNKMDLVGYDQAVYADIVKKYSEFLKEINISPKEFVPISAREGDNLAARSSHMDWYKGKTALELMDDFEKEKGKDEQVFRFPVQDIYKFTQNLDDRRIVAGTVLTGSIKVGDKVVFYPSQKESEISSIEGFNTPTRTEISTGHATGFTLKTQIYIKPGEVMCKVQESAPQFSTTFKANIFWLGKTPLIPNKKYKLKIGAARATVYVKKILNVMDASELSKDNKKQEVARHEVAECIFQTIKPIAFDLASELSDTSRFVVIDNYEIAGGGIILEKLEEDNLITDYIEKREYAWERSAITKEERAQKNSHKPKFVIITGPAEVDKVSTAKALEKSLFNAGFNAYYLGISNLLSGIASDVSKVEDREEHLRRLGEMAYVFTDAGLIFISTIPDLDDSEVEVIKSLSGIDDVVVINKGASQFSKFDVDLALEKSESPEDAALAIKKVLMSKEIIPEYFL